MLRRRIYSFIKRIVVGHPTVLQPAIEWPKMLTEKVSIGHDATLNGASLVVRNPDGCSLSIGAQSDIGCNLVFEKASSQITIGERTHIGGGLLDTACRIEIGNDVLVSFGILVMDHNSHSVCYRERKDDVVEWKKGKKDWTHVAAAPIKICDKAWVGANVIILKGVTIGEGAIVGAGSVVTKSIPAWTIAAGNPAKVIRALSEDERRLT